MKKQLSLLLLLTNLISLAQKDIILSFSSGTTFSNIRGNSIAEQNKYDFNYVGGIAIEKPINDKFSFLIGLNYDNKSFKNEVDFDRLNLFNSFDPVFSNEKRKIKITLQYLSAPILFRYYIDKKKSLFINSGPYLGFFLNSTTKVEGDKIKDESNMLFKDLDFGWSFGIGKKVKLSEKSNINIELRDNLGLINVSDVPVYGNGTVKLNSFNLLLGYEFKL